MMNQITVIEVEGMNWSGGDGQAADRQVDHRV